GNIHSDAEYRGRLGVGFPGVDLAKCAPFVEPIVRAGPKLRSASIALDSAAIGHALEQVIRAEGFLADSLKTAVQRAHSQAEELKREKLADLTKFVEVVCLPNVLEAQEEEAILLQQ